MLARDRPSGACHAALASSLSVVTVVFNNEAQIARTIESVLSQDYERLEYLVIDGHSTDGTAAVIARYERDIQIAVSEPDGGVYDAMNKGVRLASGEFIMFMNCGDVFADPNAVSSAMRSIQSDDLEQVVLGRWIRHSGANAILCRPSLENGRFNHQAIIYSRSIHAWHGDYLDVPGFTTADYLFFVTLFGSKSVACQVIDTTLAVVDVTGISAGIQTLSQKYAIDYLCGRVGRLRLLLVLAVHPLYSRLKRLLRGRS